MELITLLSGALAQLLTASGVVDSLELHPSLEDSSLFFESSCKDVGCGFAHVPHFNLVVQALERCPPLRQPKHRPLSLTKAMCA